MRNAEHTTDSNSMKTQSERRPFVVLVVSASLVMVAAAAWAQAPVIASFGRNGELVCTNLPPGSPATVEWAPTVNGPWTNSWLGLQTVTADSNGAVRVSVPMFYRVRGFPAVPQDMAVIPSGAFGMGDTFNESSESYGERPVHSVQVSGFYVSKYEVTKAVWDDVYIWGITHGYSFESGAQGKAPNHPAHSMTWYDAVKWCNARSEKEGRVPAYYTSAAQTSPYRTGQVDVQNDWVKWNAAGYRLPTEAEWEKTARGGVPLQRFPWGNTISHAQANYQGYPASAGGNAYDLGSLGLNPTFDVGTSPFTSPVGSFAPNGYGIYDVAGNVNEWCWDWWGSTYYRVSPAVDPRGPEIGLVGWSRVLRGGSWNDYGRECRSAFRWSLGSPAFGNSGLGFRVVLASGQQ